MDIEAVKAIFTTLPVDVVAAVLFAVVITVITLRFGASLAISLSLSVIVSNVLFGYLPNTFMIGPAVSKLASATIAGGIYVGLLALMTLVFYRIMSTLTDDSARPMFAIATGLATTAVVLTMWQVTPLHTFWAFGAVFQGAFGEAYRLFWLILAFIAFAFVRS